MYFENATARKTKLQEAEVTIQSSQSNRMTLSLLGGYNSGIQL